MKIGTRVQIHLTPERLADRPVIAIHQLDCGVVEWTEPPHPRRPFLVGILTDEGKKQMTFTASAVKVLNEQPLGEE